MSTLDHLTKGRIGWNVVTGYLPSAARNMGHTDQLSHDDRYDVADEYLEVLYKLWEGSWEDDAVVEDRETVSSPTPRRSTRSSTTARTSTCPHPPVGAVRAAEPRRLPGGRIAPRDPLAAENAEAVFVGAPTIPQLAATVGKIRTPSRPPAATGTRRRSTRC